MDAQLLTPPKPLSLSDASLQLGVSTKTVRKLVRSGQLPHYKFGKLYKIDQADLDQWKSERRRGGKAA